MNIRDSLLILVVGVLLVSCGEKQGNIPDSTPLESGLSSEQDPSESVVNRDSDLESLQGTYEDDFPGEMVESHAVVMVGKPKYPADFKHFDYVNPQAPKGGTLRQYSIGSYDSFNRYAQRGDMVVGADTHYDSLMVTSADEPRTYYPLIAQRVAYTKDFKEITFYLNEKARFQDGEPITAEDVVFSFDKFMTQGVPTFRKYFEPLVESFEALDKYRVKITLTEGNKDALFYFPSLKILPKHIWKDLDLAEPITEPVVGSSAYRIGDYEMGRFIEYVRDENYWAKDLPVNVGQNNFDIIRYDYYKDQNVAFEAFKAGEFDVYSESSSKNWATLYTGEAFDKGDIQKLTIPHEIPLGMQGYAFNTRKEIFQNRDVRAAIALAMDFEWMNKNLFYNQYTRTRSFFQNSVYEALGLPQGREKEILEEIRDQVPPQVFTEEFNPPQTDGSGNIRPQIRQALSLFNKAGWILRDQKLVNAETGEPFTFEILFYSPSFERVHKPFVENLAKMGISATLNMVDPTQFQNRYWEKDFDMVTQNVGGVHHPDGDYSLYWHSRYADDTYNAGSIQDPAVDYLIEGIEANVLDLVELRYWGRALDRVLTWNYYLIPQWRFPYYRVAHWNKIGKPETRPKYSLGLGTWWYEANR